MNLHTPAEKLYDLAFLEEMDDDEYLLGMLNLLVTETPQDLDAMKQAALKGDYDTIAKKAHVLKSTAGIIHVSKFVALMVAIEVSIKEEAVTAELVSLIDNASQVFALVNNGLRDRMASLQ